MDVMDADTEEGLPSAHDHNVVERVRSIVRQRGSDLLPGAEVLDFGCGSGVLFQAFRAAGFSTRGVDFADRLNPSLEGVYAVEERPYRLPFPDAQFDLVYSVAVFEHVADYRAALLEIRRVLKPDGVAVHVFPPRWRIIEPHVRVPLATWFRPAWWIRLWARAGVRKGNQRGRPWRRVAEENAEYLRHSTRYLTRGRIAREFRAVFPSTAFVEREYLHAGGGRGGRLKRFLVRLPLFARAFSAFRMRCVFTCRGATNL